MIMINYFRLFWGRLLFIWGNFSLFCLKCFGGSRDERRMSQILKDLSSWRQVYSADFKKNIFFVTKNHRCILFFNLNKSFAVHSRPSVSCGHVRRQLCWRLLVWNISFLQKLASNSHSVSQKWFRNIFRITRSTKLYNHKPEAYQ